nr:uncharacterized protein LOC106025607 isoform X4 [Cavia porcellus]
MRAPLGDLNPFLTSSASQCFLLWGKEAARLRVDGETCTGERMRMRGVDVPQLTVISICDVSSLISDLCDQPGRIELIHGSPKITEHLCAKDWTALTDPLIWLRHRLLFPWHPRR